MQFYQLLFIFALVTILVEGSRAVSIAKTITVSQSGGANFKKIQDAIDSIPSGNNNWIQIKVDPGIYVEKVTIPREKPYILLEGQDAKNTVIQWGDHGVTDISATFTSSADNFVAKRICFHNNYNVKLALDNPMSQAVAARIYGDKSAFYSCRFVGFQDTLFDVLGRHYFSDCFIEGAVDFIFGSAQSFYENCHLIFNGWPDVPRGYITAEARTSGSDPGGFVFEGGIATGQGQVFLGRAWNSHSRVIFHKTNLDIDVVPEGWDLWNQDESSLVYVEQDCYGKGSDVSKRVSWSRHSLPQSEMEQYTRSNFINDEWLTAQP